MSTRFSLICLMGMAAVFSACVHVTEVPEILRESDAGPIEIPAHAPRRGPESARVTLVEFGDFQCPYCGAVEPTVKQVLATYPDDVALVFVNLPLSIHENSLRAAEAFLAAALQGKAWEMHDQMFAHQEALADADLDQYAQSIGLDLVQFDADRASAEIADEVAQDQALAASLGVDITPTFATAHYWIVGAQPFSVFKDAVDKELARPVRDAAVDLP
jgi:protein-disulfide isomerase